MSSSYIRVPPQEGGPFAPGDVLTFQLQGAYADLTRSRLQFDLTPTAVVPNSIAPPAAGAGNLIHSMLLPGGGLSLVQKITVSCPAAGKLEEVQDVAPLAFALQTLSHGSAEIAYNELCGATNADLFPMLVPDMVNESTYKAIRVSVDLQQIIGCAKYATWPLGVCPLVIRIELAPLKSGNCPALKNYVFNGPVIACDNQGAAADFTSLTTTYSTFPRIDGGKTMQHPLLEIGDSIIVDTIPAAGSRTFYTKTITTLTNPAGVAPNGRLTIGFAAIASAVAQGTCKIWPNQFPVVFHADASAEYFESSADMLLDNSPWYVGQGLLLITAVGGAVDEQNRIVATVAQSPDNPTKVRVSFNAAMDAGANRSGFASGYEVTSASYQLTNAYYRMRALEPSPAALAKLDDQLKKGMQLGLLTVRTDAATFAANMTELDYVLPTANFARAYGILTCATISGGSTFDTVIRAFRAGYQTSQWMVGDSSDPLQPIAHDRFPNDTRADQELIRFFDHVAAASARPDGSTGSMTKLAFLPPYRDECPLAKALNAAGLPRDLTGTPVRLHVVKDDTHALRVLFYTFHLRTVMISAAGVVLMP